MNLSKIMFDAVQTIRRIERRKLVRKLDVSADQLGNGLIEVYYLTDNLRTRELIMEFMKEAGAHWMRKLITKDTSQYFEPELQSSSNDVYIDLVAANDANTAHDLWA